MQSTFENCSKAYIRIVATDHGYQVKPAKMSEFSAAQGVGERLEPKLTPMPTEVALTSLAISMARIADDTETIGRIAFSTYMRDNRKRMGWWNRWRYRREVPNEVED